MNSTSLQQDVTVLVCGSRYWDDPEVILRELGSLKHFYQGATLTIVHGAASGADTQAGDIAAKLGYRVKEYPAHWDLFGKSAGPMRNIQMLNEAKPILVLAFTKDLSTSKGTGHTVREAIARGIFVKVISN